MKRISAILICLLISVLFVSCSDEAKSEVTEQKVDVTFSFSEKGSNGNAVRVNTTLPIGMLLEIEIKGAGDFHSVETVKVQGDIDGNYIKTEAQKDKNDNYIKDGAYALKIKSATLDSQPNSVIAVIGEKGGKLYGNCVFENPETKEKSVSFSRQIVKKGSKFSLKK